MGNIVTDQQENEKKTSEVRPLVDSEIVLKAHLEIMQNDSSECLKKARVDANTGEEFFCVQVNQLVKTLHERCVEKIIEDTYSRYHKRVYRILRLNGFLDEPSIGSKCFMPPKEVRKIINQLLQGIVDQGPF